MSLDLQQELEKYPMDYIKAINLIKGCSNETRSLIYKEIYKITRIYIPDNIYKYYSLTDDDNLNDLKLKTLLNNQIYMAEYSSLNDPFDNKAAYYRNEELLKFDRLKRHNGYLFDDLASYTRISSFTDSGINNMPMWAHYSNNHSGYCVKYNTKQGSNFELRTSLFPVQYVDERVNITSIIEDLMNEMMESLEKAKLENKKEAIINNLTLPYILPLLSCIKQTHWRYEKEIRCIAQSGISYINAVPSAIYIGKNCSYKNIQELINIAHILDIAVFKMDYDKSTNDYQLIASRIS